MSISPMSKEQLDEENELGQRLRLISDSESQEEDGAETATSRSSTTSIRPIFNGFVCAVILIAVFLFVGTQIHEHLESLRNRTTETQELESREICCEGYNRLPNGTYNVSIQVKMCPPYQSGPFNFVRAVTILVTDKKMNEVLGSARFSHNKNDIESLPTRLHCDVSIRLNEDNGTILEQQLFAIFKWQAVNVGLGAWESNRAVLPLNFTCNFTNVLY